MTSKSYKEELKDLERGLSRLNNMNPKEYRVYEKIRRARDIQEERIRFFKLGYSLRDKELKEIRELDLEAEK